MRRFWVFVLGVFAVFAVCFPAQADEPSFTIEQMSPEVLGVDDSLTLELGFSGPPAQNVDLKVFLEPESAIHPEHLDQYLAGSESPGVPVYFGSGTASDHMSIVIPANDLPTPEVDIAGPHGLTVVASFGDVSLEARTIVVFDTDEYPRTEISVLAIEPADESAFTDVLGVSIASPRKSADLVLPGDGADLSLLAAGGAPVANLLNLASATIPDSDSMPVLASELGFTNEAIAAFPGRAIIAPKSWSADKGLITPNSRTEVAGTTVVDQWKAGTDLLSAPEGSPAEELVIRQKLRSASMWVGLEDPSDHRTLLASVSDGTTAAQALRIKALLDSAWVAPASLQDVLESPISTVPRPPIPPMSQDAIDAIALLQPLSELYSTAVSVSKATSAGVSLVEPLKGEVLSAAGAQLDEAQRLAIAGKATSRLQDITQMIEVIPLGPVNIVNSTANFPVSIKNNGDVNISVEVFLQPSDPRLQSKESVFVKVPGKGQTEVSLPVTAVGYGDVEAVIRTATPGGITLDDSQSVSVRVRANWEDTGTVVALSTLGLLFVFGLVRTIIRRRRRTVASRGEGIE